MHSVCLRIAHLIFTSVLEGLSAIEGAGRLTCAAACVAPCRPATQPKCFAGLLTCPSHRLCLPGPGAQVQLFRPLSLYGKMWVMHSEQCLQLLGPFSCPMSRKRSCLQEISHFPLFCPYWTTLSMEQWGLQSETWNKHFFWGGGWVCLLLNSGTWGYQ